jgi:hypothetical protein
MVLWSELGPSAAPWAARFDDNAGALTAAVQLAWFAATAAAGRWTLTRLEETTAAANGPDFVALAAGGWAACWYRFRRDGRFDIRARRLQQVGTEGAPASLRTLPAKERPRHRPAPWALERRERRCQYTSCCVL